MIKNVKKSAFARTCKRRFFVEICDFSLFFRFVFEKFKIFFVQKPQDIVANWQ